MTDVRLVVTSEWLFEGLDWYQTIVLSWYLPRYVADDDWQ